MKNERSSSFDSARELHELEVNLTKDQIIPIGHDSRLGKAIGLRGKILIPVAGALGLLLASCSPGDIKINPQAQASEDNSSDKPSVSEYQAPLSEWVITPEPPAPIPTETPTLQAPTPSPTLDAEAARKRLEARNSAIQKALEQTLQPTATPEPKPTEAPTPTATSAPEPTPTPEPEKKHVVRPVLFVPANLKENPDDVANINNAMREVQRFYAEQLDGKTFQYENPVLIRGQKDLQFYCLKPIETNQCVQDPSRDRLSDPKVLKNILQDIQRQDPTFSDKRQDILILAVGFSGYAWGGWGGDFGQDRAAAMLGEWRGLDALAGRYAKGTDTAGCHGSRYPTIICRDGPGTTIHELGHTFRLDHPDWRLYDKNVNERLVMTPYPNACIWPICEFLPSEKQTLLKSPFIHVVFDAKK